MEQDLPSPLPPGSSKPDTEEGGDEAAGTSSGDYVCAGLPQESCVRLLRACVQMIGLPVEPDALNAIMRYFFCVNKNDNIYKCEAQKLDGQTNSIDVLTFLDLIIDMLCLLKLNQYFLVSLFPKS